MASEDTNVRMIRGKCPICQKPTLHPYRPFCSSRCADVDLARWLGGNYAIAGHEDGDEDGEGGSAAATEEVPRHSGQSDAD